jgi:fructokinase
MTVSDKRREEFVQTKTIISFGELLWDVFPTGEVLGGAPANFAYRIHSLGCQTHLITRLGNDARGRRAAEILNQKGLSLTHIQQDRAHPTGTVPITIHPDGSHDFTILANVAYDHIQLTPSLLTLAAQADVICFGTLIQRSPTSRQTLHKLLDHSRALNVLDLNLRKDCYSPETIDTSLNYADILKLNEDESNYLSNLYSLPTPPDQFAQAAVRKWDLDCCIITVGPNGAAAATPTQTIHSPPPNLPGPIIDTVGCGDAFTAAFLHHHLSGASLSDSCAAANHLAAQVARTRGGMEPIAIP